MKIRVLTALLAAGAIGCGSEAPAPNVDAAPPTAASVGGLYKVSGVTVDLNNADRREISGAVILNVDGDKYTSTFDLNTMFPTQEGSLEAQVIGEGSGRVEGRTLVGDARTQVVVSTVPGVDPAFAFVPRTTTTRIVNESVTKIAADGSVEIDIENRPAEGERYSPTRTTLRGRRVDPRSRAMDSPAPDPHAPSG